MGWHQGEGKTLQPRHAKFENVIGEIIKESELANEAAKSLSEVQWALPTDTDLNMESEASFLFENRGSMDDYQRAEQSNLFTKESQTTRT